jgi:hypothetical protein
MGGRRWHWDMSISMATDEGIRRLEVAVRPVQDSQPLLTLTGFATP